MLKIVKSMKDMNTEQLLAVYEESIRRNGGQYWRRLPAEMQQFKAEEDLLSYLRDDFFRQSGAFYALWVADGVYQSAVRLEPYREGLLLQALETAPNARNKGYAGCLLSELIVFLRQTEHKVIYSHVDKRNLASLKVHRNSGFQQISDCAVYIDGTVTQNSCTLGIEL